MMDAQKIAFVLGEISSGDDPNDREVRHRLVEQRIRTERPTLDQDEFGGAFVVRLYQLVADQIAEDDPPEVWQTARRLLDSGLGASFVMSNLMLAVAAALVPSLKEGAALDEGYYRERLGQLPLPPVAEMFEAFENIVSQRRFVSADELIEATVTSFGAGDDPNGDAAGASTKHWVELAFDELIETDASIMMVPPDLVVHVPTLLSGSTLTHRLTEAERSGGWIPTGVDLAPLLCRSDPLLWEDGSEVEIDMVTEEAGILEGGPGWLEGFEPGSLIGFRLVGNSVRLEAVDEPAPPAPGVVDAVQAAYDREVAEPWLPVGADEIVVGMLLDHPEILSTATFPLSELLARAGLEQRGREFAHDESVWRQARTVGRWRHLYDLLPDDDERRKAVRVLDLLEADERSSEAKQEALATLGDGRLLSLLTDQVLDLDDDEEQLDEVAAFAEDLLAAARRPADGVPARWLLAVVSERRGDPLAGQAQLELAVQADPDFEPAVDRLAWYLSDRGDAVGAVRLWRRLGADVHDSDDLREIAPFAETPSSNLGRNEPCWCGSGRKFKHCHLGEPAAFPLPERVGWLCRKAVAYLERRGGGTLRDVYQYAVIRADGDDSNAALDRAFADPMVMDVTLHEGGWFESFLAERGALLPDDEAMLAAAWALVDRTLYEVVETRPGKGLLVRDLRDAELIEVRERTFSRQARVGQVVCGRAVPDGETHQFIGGIVGVATGQEKDLLDLLDDDDGEELLGWIAARERPPRLATRESEDLRACRVVVETTNPDTRAVLDRLYEVAGPDVWSEHHQLANGESILRATITLQGSRITIETMSEPRVERVLAALRGQIAGLEVISDKRDEVDLSQPPPLPAGLSRSSRASDDPAVKEALRAFIAQRDQAWCDEEIPALGGLTPRQAAADPAGRESLERLLGEYGSHVDPDEDPDLVPQHPDRLRLLLGLL
jgi:hypothetical protein